MHNIEKGHLHPLTIVIRDIAHIFSEIGFTVALGPEVETEFYNFDALNIPPDHPARDMQQTFWLRQNDDKRQTGNGKRNRLLLRTHTSPVQVRYLHAEEPPLAIIVPGKVFRNEATDATHEVQFFQIEGLKVDRKVSLADLKGTLEYFFKKLFAPNIDIRFRPSFFPFTEPSVEVDVKKNGEWLEVMGGGMVHPNVFRQSGRDPAAWRGFAFGGGIDRLAMLRYRIPDIRFLYHGDLRVVNQF